MIKQNGMRVFRRSVLVVVAVLAIAAGGFFAIGGGQIVSLMRGPRLPSAGESRKLADDLSYFRTAVLANEGGLSESQQQKFDAAVRTAHAPASTDELGWIAMRATRHLDNAHSQVLDPRMHRLPIRVHWFKDGLYVVKARRMHAGLLGQRIQRIGGVAPEILLTRLSESISGNAPWKRYRSEYFLVAPHALAASEATVMNDCVEIEYEAVSSASSDRVCADSELLPGNAFWEWLHLMPGSRNLGTSDWNTWKSSVDRLPLYLRDAEKTYVTFDAAELDATYVRLNGSIDDGPQALSAFLDDAINKIKQSPRRHVVVDFRFNWGGGYHLTRKFTAELPKSLPAGGRIFLVTGPNTFSAGLLAAARLRHFGGERVTVVGEPAGDALAFRSEGFVVTLPISKIVLYVSKYSHDFESGCGWFGDCYVLDKFIGVSVPSIEPQIHAANTGMDYGAGKDRVLEAIRNSLH
jgi:hypothetical protein